MSGDRKDVREQTSKIIATAAVLLGSPATLAMYLGVDLPEIDAWIAGTADAPPDVVGKAAEAILTRGENGKPPPR